MSSTSGWIALVTANEAVRQELQSILQKLQPHHQLLFASSADALLSTLTGVASSSYYQAQRFPAIILFDWELPEQSAESLVQMIRTNPLLKRLVLLPFATNALPVEAARYSYQSGCNAFMTLPDDPARLRERLALVLEYWLYRVELPYRGMQDRRLTLPELLR